MSENSKLDELEDRNFNYKTFNRADNKEVQSNLSIKECKSMETFKSNNEAKESLLLRKSKSFVGVIVENNDNVNHVQSLDRSSTAETNLPTNIASQSAEEITTETSTDINVEFCIFPSEQKIALTAAAFQTIQQLKENLSDKIKATSDSMTMLLNGESPSSSSTLKEFPADDHNSIYFEVFLGNYVKNVKSSKPNKINVTVQKGPDCIEVVEVTIERLTKRKPFLGGYKHRLTKIEYHNATTQTGSPPSKKVHNENRNSRNTQTCNYGQRSTQTNKNSTTQMTRTGFCSLRSSDKVVNSKPYETYDKLMEKKCEAAVIIQSHFRRWREMKLFKHLKQDIEKNIELKRIAEEKLKQDKVLREKKFFEKLLNPATKEDFEYIYSMLEKWRQDELNEIENLSSEPERKAALYLLSLEETKLVSEISRKKNEVLQITQENRRKRLLRQMAAPKIWRSFDGRLIEVDTPDTLQAKHLMGLYESLNTKYFSNHERLDILESLRHTVQDNDSPMVKELMKLVDREIDSMLRGFSTRNLEGLRKRISTLLFMYCKQPIFNPIAEKFTKISGLNRKEICYNPRTGSHAPVSEFDFRLTSDVIKTSKKAKYVDNTAHHRLNYLHYANMLTNLKRKEESYNDNSQVVYLLKKEDIKYIVEVIWNGVSILSGLADVYDLRLTRWDKDTEWSPWNCVLLTQEEADCHSALDDVNEIYGLNFRTDIRTKHTHGRLYFSKVSEMSEVLRKNMTSRKFAALTEVKGRSVIKVAQSSS